MSKVVDERVVEMRFDNSNFERNIQGTLSTLDKFKQKLHLDGATRGLETISKAAKDVDMSNLGKGLETVQAKFSALEVMGVTALANLTNSAVNAGKRIAASLTIDPIKSGFNEYELKMNSVQTIMASTGESLETVNKYLEELNKYSDQTIYSFSDMTQNIGKFTNAGVKLEDAVLAIKGISNEAAISGANANEASRAMYNFAQALSAGYVKLIDWKSIENANMATVEFKNQLIQSAVAAGTLTKTTDGLYKTLGGTVISATKNFNDSLKDEWMTTEVLVGTLREYADENTEIGKKATQAATEVKTFTMMLDTLKESAQSGWAKTWEIMFGDFYEGKELWTSLTNAIGSVIDKMSDFRNKVLESAFGRSFTSLSNKIKGALDPITKTADKVSDVVDTIKDYDNVVNEIIAGKWGNHTERWDALTEAGYDWAHAQNLVNERLDCSVRYTTKLADSQTQVSKSQSKLTQTDAERLAGLVKLSDKELQALGYTKEQIEALRELKVEADRVGYSIEDFVNNIDKINGRTLFINSFKNIGNSLMTIFGSIKDAWVEVFEITPEGVGQTLYNLIAAFHKLTTHLIVGDETADKLKRTFKGLFAIVDIITTIIAGPTKIAFKILGKILGAFDMDILGLTAKIGDAIVAFRDWIDSIIDFNWVFEKIAPYITIATDAIKKWTSSLKDGFIKIFNKIKPSLTKFLNTINGWISDLKDKFSEVAPNIIAGLKNGLIKGTSAVWNAVVNIGKTIIEAIKNILGIHSPSTVMEEMGTNTMAGYLKGLGEGSKDILNFIMNVFRAIAGFFPQLKIFQQLATLIPVITSLGSDVTSGFVAGLVDGAQAIFSTIGAIVTKLVDIVKGMLGIHSPSKVFMLIGKFAIAGLILGIVGSKTGLFDAMKNLFDPVIDWVKEKFSSFRDWLSNTEFPEIKMEYILGIGALVGLALFAKKLLDIATDVGKGVKAFGDGVSGIGSAFKRLTSGFEPIKKGKWDTIANNALKLSLAISILAGSVYVLAQLDTGKLWSSIGAIAVLAAIVTTLGVIIGKIDLKGQKFGKLSLMLVSMSTSLWIMASAIKKLEFLNKDNIGYVLGGTAAMIIGLSLILAVLGKLVKGKTAANIDKAGITIFKIAAALAVMVFVVKQLSKLDEAALIKGGIAITAFGVIITGLIWATKLAGKNTDKAGGAILKIALAIGVMGLVVKMLGNMDTGALVKGGIAVTALGGIIVGLIAATKLAAGNNVRKVGGTILAVSTAIMMLGVTAAVLSMISPTGLVKGIVAVTALGGIIVGLIAATKLATEKELKGVASTLFAASLAIAIMGVTAIVLSMISIPGLIKGVVAVAILGSIIALMIAATKNAGDCHKNIQMMALAIGVMAASVVVLSFIDPTKLEGAVIALGIIMGMFALMTEAAGRAQKAVGTILVMTLAVGALAGLIYILAGLPVEQTIGSAIALGGLMLALTVALGALSVIGKFAKQALVGVLALTTLAVPLFIFIQLLKSMSDVENAVNITTALITMLMGFTLVLGVLTVIGLGGPAAIIGVGSLLALIVAIGGLVTGIGWLMEKFPDLEKFMNGGIETLKLLARGIGEIISAFGVGLTSGLPEIGENLSSFMDNLAGFISGADSIKNDLGKKILILSGAIVLLTAADLIAGIGSFIQCGSSFAQLGADLSAFMTKAMPFIAGANMVNAESLAGIKSLAEAILILTASNIIDGLTSWFTGGASFEEFGAELVAFGPYLAEYAKAVAGIDGAAVESSAKAAKSLAEMASSLPNSGGVVGWFAGENDMNVFGEQLVAFGTAIKNYSVAITGIAVEPIMASVEAGKALAEMADVIPNLGGVVSWFTGDNDLATFGTQIVSFGSSIKQYSLMVTGIMLEPIMQSVEAGKALAGLNEVIPNLGGMVTWFTGDNDFASFGTQIVSFGASLVSYSTTVAGLNMEAITMSVTAASELAKLAEALPTDGGFWSLFKDDKINFEDFGEEIKKLGLGIKGYSESVCKLNANAVFSSIEAVKKLIAVIKTMAGLDASGVETFSEAIGELGEVSVDKFVKAFTSSTSELNNVGSKLIKAVADGAKSATGNLTNVAKSASNTLNKAFSDKQSTLKSTGSKLITELISGINSKKESVYTAMEAVAGRGVTGARDKYQNFIKAGSYVVSGFVKGINDNKYKAVDAGTALGKAAYKAAKAAIDSNSPSKKFMELGMFADQGLAKGLLNYAYLATRASAGLGRDIVTSMQEELDINSPSKVVKDEVGKYVVQGLAEGIKSDMSAEEAAEQKAKNITDAFKAEMDKYDSKMTTSDLEYELWEVHNEAASSAEKTAQKAASIYKRVAAQTEKVALAQAEYEITFNEFGENAEATQKAYNAWIEEQIGLNNETKTLLDLRTQSIEDANEAAELNMSSSDLKKELWEAENQGATDVEKASKNLDTILEKLPKQAEAVGLAQATWEAAKQRYGEGSNETIKAYNEYLQSQIDMQTLTTELSSAYDESKYYLGESRKAYWDYLKNHRENLLNAGITEDEILKAASLDTGFSPELSEKLLTTKVSDATANAMSIIEETYNKYAGMTFENLAGQAESYGQVYGESISDGVSSSATGANSAVQTVTAACTSATTTNYSDWIKIGEQFVSKFAEGVNNAVDTATKATITMISSAYQAAIDFINSEDGGKFTPTITPIFDLSGIQNGVNQMNGMFATNTAALADINVRLTNDSISELSNIAEEMRISNESNHTELVGAIANLRGDFGSLIDAINDIDIVMDSGTLVGEIINKIDTKLGQITNYKGRGN